MNEIVWVYGGSGAGKETFIREVFAGNYPDLLHKLQWEDKTIIPCTESIDFVVQESGDGNKEKREVLPARILELSTNTTNAVILIKGQDLDLSANRLIETKKLIPQATHRIVFVATPLDEVFERWKYKKWWKDTYTKEDVISWEKKQKERLGKLKNEFEIMTINGSTVGNYELLEAVI